MTNVTLTPLTEEYLETVRNWRNSPEISQYMFNSEPIGPQQQVDWFNRVKDDPTQKYFVIKFGDRAVGVASVDRISKLFDSCFWAFYLGDTSIWGQGVGTKVEFMMIDYVFKELGLNKLRGEVLHFNVKGIKMHERFGFRREGYLREHVLKDGKYLDMVTIGLLRRDWEAYRAVLEKEIFG